MLNGIKKARLCAGITQTELAKRLDISPGSISQWEQGRTRPSVKRLKRIAEILGTTVEELLIERVS